MCGNKTNPKQFKPEKRRGKKKKKNLTLPRKAKLFSPREKEDCFLFPLRSFLWSNCSSRQAPNGEGSKAFSVHKPYPRAIDPWQMRLCSVCALAACFSERPQNAINCWFGKSSGLINCCFYGKAIIMHTLALIRVYFKSAEKIQVEGVKSSTCLRKQT